MSPQGFYLNRTVLNFGQRVESAMNQAENGSRKNRKPGLSTDRLANAARLGALSRMLGIDIARNRSVGTVSNTDPTKQHGSADAGGDIRIVLGKPF